jgi:hypothetical protein
LFVEPKVLQNIHRIIGISIANYPLFGAICQEGRKVR